MCMCIYVEFEKVGSWDVGVCLYRSVYLYHGSDMMDEMRRRKPKPTLLLIEGIFNLPHHIGMV